MTKIKDLHKKWMNSPAYRIEYDALEEEFVLASSLIEARSNFNRLLGKSPTIFTTHSTKRGG